MWLVRVHGPPSKLDSNADREVRRDALDRALTPRDSDRGRVSVFEVADLEEARETACLHKALGPARLASVDFVLLPADAFGVDDVVVTPDARHSLLLSASTATSVVPSVDPPRSLSLGYGYVLPSGRSLNLGATAGLSEAVADWTAWIGWRTPVP